MALSRCDDKRVTRHILAEAGLNVPEQQSAQSLDANLGFLARHRRIVVKPARGEQGAGVSVDIRAPEALEAALEQAHAVCDAVILEQLVEGEDLRVIVINDEVVAAAVRRPPCVIGTGHHTVAELIEKRSRRREPNPAG